MIYEDNTLKRILVDGGYIEDGRYHFYVQDHLGNNRMVVDQEGAVAQITHYYPFGMSFAESTNASKQPYKYNGKELDMENSLNTYDYEARLLSVAVPRFTTMDPLAENYYSWSPYHYAGNNPILITDPTGMDWYIFNEETGKFEEKIEFEGQHRMAVRSTDKEGNTTYTFHDFNDLENDSKDIDDGLDNTQYISRNAADRAARLHDLNYDAIGVSGFEGAVYSTKVLAADKALIERCKQILKDPNSSKSEKTHAQKNYIAFSYLITNKELRTMPNNSVITYP